MTASRIRRTQCISCGTKHPLGHPCPKCNNSHEKRRKSKRGSADGTYARAVRNAARWRGDLQAKGTC